MPKLLVSGAVNWDTTLFVNELPKPGEEIKVERVVSVPGGKGANTAVAAARILGKDEVAIVGMLGNDEIAKKQTEILIGEGIDVSCLGSTDRASGQAYVVVDANGENMVLTHRAANKELTRQFVRSETVVRIVDATKSVIIIDPPLEAAIELALQARKNDRIVVFSPATLVNHGFSALEKLLLAANYVIQNEHEAKYLTSEDDGTKACEKLSGMLGGKAVITTLGAEGCVLCHQGRKETVPAIDPEQFGMKKISTVGAGDTFVGAFSSFKLLGKEDLEAALLANVAAALKTTREQTRGSPTYEEIRRYAESDVMRPTYNAIRNHLRPSRTS